MRNKDKAIDFLNEEYQKILPDNTGADEDTKTIEQIEAGIYEKLEAMIDQKFKDFENKSNEVNNVDSAPNNEVETKDQEDSTDGINED